MQRPPPSTNPAGGSNNNNNNTNSNDDEKVTDEFPLPPWYFKRFEDAKEEGPWFPIEPPPIPAELLLSADEEDKDNNQEEEITAFGATLTPRFDDEDDKNAGEGDGDPRRDRLKKLVLNSARLFASIMDEQAGAAYGDASRHENCLEHLDKIYGQFMGMAKLINSFLPIQAREEMLRKLKQQTAQRNAYADLLEGHIARTRTAVAEALEESTQEAQKVEVVIVSDAMEQDDS